MRSKLRDDLFELFNAVDVVHQAAKAESQAFDIAQAQLSRMGLVLLQEAHRSELDAIHILVARRDLLVCRHAETFGTPLTLWRPLH